MYTGCWSTYDGETYDVIRDEKDLDQLFHCIKANILSKEKNINSLNKELKALKENYNKDEEIAKLIRERDELREDSYRGFPISKEEEKSIKEWMNNHEQVHKGGHGVSGGKYTYCFVPTSIGVIGTIKCSCGEEFCFQDIC